MHDVRMRLGDPVNKKHWESDMDRLQQNAHGGHCECVCGIIPNLCILLNETK